MLRPWRAKEQDTVPLLHREEPDLLKDAGPDITRMAPSPSYPSKTSPTHTNELVLAARQRQGQPSL